MSKRNFGLDVLRAIAIFMVMWGHSLVFLSDYSFAQWLHYKPFDGVDLFFVISGFLIGGILLRDIQNEGASMWLVWWRFILRRWLRTLPAYWTILALLMAIVSFAPHWASAPIDGLSYFFFYQNLSEPLIGFFWESWSLSVEEWFYLCCPFVVFVLSRRVHFLKAYIAVALLMIVFSMGYRQVRFDPHLDDFWFDVNVRKMIFARWDGLGYGLLMAACYQTKWVQKHKRWMFFLGLFVLLGLSAVDIDNTLHFKQVLYFGVVALALACILPRCLDLKTNSALLERWIKTWATHSYALYLVNLTLVCSLLRDLENAYPNVSSLIWFVSFWILSWCAARILYLLVERPVLKWRDTYLSVLK